MDKVLGKVLKPDMLFVDCIAEIEDYLVEETHMERGLEKVVELNKVLELERDKV